MSNIKSKTKPRILGIILARGGSKGIPKKNIRLLNGIPLIAYTIQEGLKSKYIFRLIISSDNDEIRKIAESYGAEAPFKRPFELSTDTAKSLPCLQHALQWAENDEGQKYDYIIELMCTNPLKTVEDIDTTIEKLIQTEADSVIGMAKVEDCHPARIKKIVDDHIVDFCVSEPNEARRQDLRPFAYVRNSSIYAMRRDILMIQGKRYGTKNSRPYIFPSERSIDLHSEKDWIAAEYLLKHKTN